MYIYIYIYEILQLNGQKVRQTELKARFPDQDERIYFSKINRLRDKIKIPFVIT